MTQLLVSVRNASEAAAALAGGAGIIDVKEPNRGSLGAADLMVLRDVLAMVERSRPTSAACGELVELDIARVVDLPRGLDYIKLGLAGCSERADWPDLWATALEHRPPSVEAVAVVYADWQTARAPSPDQVVRHAFTLGCAAVLVDTFDKSGAVPLDALCDEALREVLELASEAGMTIVLAGCLKLESLSKLTSYKPDCIAVRGAVCNGGREGTLCEHKVRAWAEAVKQLTAA